MVNVPEHMLKGKVGLAGQGCPVSVYQAQGFQRVPHESEAGCFDLGNTRETMGQVKQYQAHIMGIRQPCHGAVGTLEPGTVGNLGNVVQQVPVAEPHTFGLSCAAGGVH